MDSMPAELGNKPKLSFERHENQLEQPIRLLADESNKENVHSLESDGENIDRNQPLYKRARMEYSSPEKIEMLNSLSPIKLYTEGEDIADTDAKRSVAVELEEAMKSLQKEDNEEEEEEEAFAKLENSYNRSPAIRSPSLSDKHTNSKETDSAFHETMSPIMVKRQEELCDNTRSNDEWEAKFENLFEEIHKKSEDIRQLTAQTAVLKDKLIREERIVQEQELYLIKQERECSNLKEQLRSFDSLETEHENISKKFEACKQKLKEVKIELSMTNQNNQILSEKFEKEYAKFAENENLVNEWKDKYNSVSSELNASANKLTTLKKELQLKEEEFNNKVKQLDDLQIEIADLKNNNDKEKNELKQMLSDKDQILNELEEKLKYFESKDSDEISSLKQDLEKAQADLCDKNEQIKHLEYSLTTKEAHVQQLHSQVDELSKEKDSVLLDLENTRRDLDSLAGKTANIESEQLAELETLHQNMSQMEKSLKENVSTISSLTAEIREMESKCKSLELENNDLKKLLKANEDITKEKSTDTESSKVKELMEKIAQMEKTIAASETETNKKLQLLAEDLYIQYSSKHEQKVKMLKKGYETRYQDLIDKLTIENNALHDEVGQLQKTVEIERAEKQELIKSLDAQNE